MRAITKLLILSLLAVGLLAAPLALAGGPETGEERSAAGKARGDDHRTNATASHDDDDHRDARANATARNHTSDRANFTAARASYRENMTAVRESWHENATATRERCHANDFDHPNATKANRTAEAQCIKTGYAAWREANAARLEALRDAFKAWIRGHRGHHHG